MLSGGVASHWLHWLLWLQWWCWRIDYVNDDKNRYSFLFKVSPSQQEVFSIEKFLTSEEALGKRRDEADLDEQTNHGLEGRQNDSWII